MKHDIACVTTTRDRPLAFGLLEKWVAGKTLLPDGWFVVNDGATPYNYTMGQEVIQRTPAEGDNSLCENWLAVVERLDEFKKVIVLDDDDWIHPVWIATAAANLDEVPLVGVCNDLYFNVRLRKFRKCWNGDHASLGATAFTWDMLPLVARIARERRDVWIDVQLWGRATGRLVHNKAPDGRAWHVGIKGMPGAKGLGSGHGNEGSGDPTMAKLAEWIGKDVAEYRRISASAWQ